MKSKSQTAEVSKYDAEVRKAYFKIYRMVKALLATIERHELRCILIRMDAPGIEPDYVMHQLISPLLYLCLERKSNKLSIRFGVEQLTDISEYTYITCRFVRLLYKLTAPEHTTINIEDCVDTRYIITDCSALYEHIEERMKHHSLYVIEYKLTASKRNRCRLWPNLITDY